jgi:hypothetical protein
MARSATQLEMLDRHMTDEQVLLELSHAFAGCTRPEHFTNFRHCCEYAEHDELLRSRDRDTLQVEDVGNPGWDPLCFTSADGLLYYLPALGRLALAEPADYLNWYVPQLHFHLTYEDAKNRILVAASPVQRWAVVHLLRHIIATRAALCETWSCREDLVAAAELWER